MLEVPRLPRRTCHAMARAEFRRTANLWRSFLAVRHTDRPTARRILGRIRVSLSDVRAHMVDARFL